MDNAKQLEGSMDSSSEMAAQQHAQNIQQQPFVRPLAARVTEEQIQALKSGFLAFLNRVNFLTEGGSVRPGSSLADFYKDLEQYTPAIPDAVALYYMRKVFSIV